jgi:large conductance mechanosensitive channel
MRSWASDFNHFPLRGNVVDLAVGIVVGVAFAALVQAAVKDLLPPLIAAIFGKPGPASAAGSLPSRPSGCS